jgi:hypothetical protein
VREEGVGLDAARKEELRAVLDRMAARSRYCDACATDAAGLLVRRSFAKDL